MAALVAKYKLCPLALFHDIDDFVLRHVRFFSPEAVSSAQDLTVPGPSDPFDMLMVPPPGDEAQAYCIIYQRIRHWLTAAQYHLSLLMFHYLASVQSMAVIFPDTDFAFFRTASIGSSPVSHFAWLENSAVERIAIVHLGGDHVDRLFITLGSALAALARGYNTIPSLLNRLACTRAQALPSSMHATVRAIERGREDLPAEVASYLTTEWRSWGERLVEYRDCIEHFVVAGQYWAPVVTGVVSPQGSVGVSALLPDNPKAHNFGSFSFENKTDYLIYAHATYFRFLELATAVADFVRDSLAGEE